MSVSEICLDARTSRPASVAGLDLAEGCGSRIRHEYRKIRFRHLDGNSCKPPAGEPGLRHAGRNLQWWRMRNEYETPLDGHQLAAFAAVIELGSFDAAAERLHVTPSAVSQRIKALEQRVGQVLVVREKPCTATAAGVPLLRLAAQTAMLESEALAEMGGGDGASAADRGRGQRRFDGDLVYRGVRRAAPTCCSTSGSRTRTTRRGCCARAW